MEICHKNVHKAELEAWDYDDTGSHLKGALAAFLEPGNDGLQRFLS